MKLFLVHCGYYDPEICNGVYESHANYFVAAESFEEARARAKALPQVRLRKMHVDGLQEIVAVDGYRVALAPDRMLTESTIVNSHRHRELAPRVDPVQN